MRRRDIVLKDETQEDEGMLLGRRVRGDQRSRDDEAKNPEEPGLRGRGSNSRQEGKRGPEAEGQRLQLL